MGHLVPLGLFQRVRIVFKVGTGIAQGRVEPEFVKVVAQVIVGADLLLLGRLVFRRIEQVIELVPVQCEHAHLFQQVPQHLKKIPVDLEVASHVGLPQGQGRGRKQLRFRDVFVDDDAEEWLSFADFILLSVQVQFKGILVEPVQIMH